MTVSKPFASALPFEEVDQVAFRKFCDDLNSAESPERLGRVMRALAKGDLSGLTEQDRGHAYGVLRFVEILQRVQSGNGPGSVGGLFYGILSRLADQSEQELAAKLFLAEAERLGLLSQARTLLEARNSPNQKDLHLASVEFFKAMDGGSEYQAIRDYAGRAGLSVETVARSVQRSKSRLKKG